MSDSTEENEDRCRTPLQTRSLLLISFVKIVYILGRITDSSKSAHLSCEYTRRNHPSLPPVKTKADKMANKTFCVLCKHVSSGSVKSVPSTFFGCLGCELPAFRNATSIVEAYVSQRLCCIQFIPEHKSSFPRKCFSEPLGKKLRRLL